MGRAATARRRAVSDDLPAILRITPQMEKVRAAARAKAAASGVAVADVATQTAEPVMVTSLVRVAQNAAEEAGFSVHKGVIPARWLGDPGVVAQLHANAERYHGKQEKREEKEARAAKSHRGWAKLALIVANFEKKPKLARLKRELAAAGVEVRKGRVHPDSKERALEIALACAPAPGRACSAGNGGGAAPGGGKRASLPQGVIRLARPGHNPYEGGKAKRHAKLLEHHGKTVAEYLAAKGNVDRLINALAEGEATVEGVDVGKKESGGGQGAGKRADADAAGAVAAKARGASRKTAPAARVTRAKGGKSRGKQK